MNNDLISRQAAYDELFDMCNRVKKWAQVANDDKSNAIIEACKATLIEIKTRIAKLPARQPEPLTVKEQRKDFIDYYEAFWTPAFKEQPKNNAFVLVQSVFGDQFVAKYEADEKEWYTYEENTPWSPELIAAWRFLPKQYTGPKSERDFSGSKTPYEDISIYIEDHINGILDDYVVKIRLDGKTYTEILTYNGEYFEWLNDWYEGEKEIELLDFFPLEEAIRGVKNV